jgi:hypothetical protein
MKFLSKRTYATACKTKKEKETKKTEEERRTAERNSSPAGSGSLL